MFSHIFDELNGVRINKSDAQYKEITNSVYYILSFLHVYLVFFVSLERSMKDSFSEKIYKMILSDINKKWTLQICAQALHTSVSTLKGNLMQRGMHSERYTSMPE